MWICLYWDYLNAICVVMASIHLKGVTQISLLFLLFNRGV